MNFREQAQRQLDYVVGLRRHFHANPELAYQEFATTDRIAEELSSMGIPFARLTPTGLVGEITGAHPGRTLLIRAEIDALPIQEETEVPFRSRTDGIMHACGHDANTAMLLGAARVLTDMREQLHGNVRLLFEPAEELNNGAAAVIAQNVLEGVDAVLALHISSQVPSGAICIGGRRHTASGHLFPHPGHREIHPRCPAGKGCQRSCGGSGHRRPPCSPIVPLEHSAYDRVLISLGTLHSGSSPNTCPESAQLEGTIRAYTKEATGKVVESLRRMAESCAATYRCTAQVHTETVW